VPARPVRDLHNFSKEEKRDGISFHVEVEKTRAALVISQLHGWTMQSLGTSQLKFFDRSCSGFTMR
jgi:hypothetical protein